MIKRNLRLKSHVPDQAYQAVYKKIETKVSSRAAKTIIYSPRSSTCSYLIRSNNSTPRNFSQQQIIPSIIKVDSPSISFRTETTKIQRKIEIDIFASVYQFSKKKQFHSSKIFSNNQYIQNIQQQTKLLQNNNHLRNSVLFLKKISQNLITQRKMQITDKIKQKQKQRLNFDNQEDYKQTNFYVKMYLNDMLIQQITVNSIINIPVNKQKQSKKQCIFRRSEIQQFDCQIENINVDDTHFRIQNPIQSFGIISYPDFEELNAESFPEMDQDDDELFIEDNHQLNLHNKSQQKPIEMLLCFRPYNQEQFPIISLLDDKTKNKLLSVDYSQTDKLIYESNIFDKIVPDLSHLTDNKYVTKYSTKLLNQKYSSILIGTFKDLLQLTDLEHEHQPQEQQIQLPKLLKQQTKFKLKSQTSRYFTPQNKLQRIDSKISILNNSFSDRGNKYQNSMENTDEIIENCSQIVLSHKEIKNMIKLGKYQVYNNMVKSGKSKLKIAAMLIEHNMVNELGDFLRQNLNFKLNQQMKDGTPLIIIAARAGYREIMQLFIDERVDTHQIDQDGKDAYYHAIQCQNYDVADLLVNSGY